MKKDYVYLDINRVRRQVDFLQEQKSILRRCINKMEQEEGKLRWQGKSRDIYIRKHEQMIDELRSIELKLDNLTENVRRTAEKIQKTDEELASQWRR